jgi:uncharacterized membrane protein
MELWRYTAELMGVVAGGALAVFGLLEGRWLLAAVSGVLVVLALRIIQLRVDNRRLRNRDLGRLD